VRPTEWTIEDVTGPIRALDWDNEREVNFVRKSWWKSARVKPPQSRFPLVSDVLGSTDYWTGGLEARDRMMQRSEIRVAVSSAGSTVLGWAAVEPARSLVHYVFVQQDFRRRGLARQMVADMISREAWFWCRTHDSSQVPLPPKWRFSVWRVLG
jgi:GNAT superfamily N-acetyltransferase